MPDPGAPADTTDAHLAETPVERQQLLRGNFLDVRRDTVRISTGDTATREYIVHPGAVAIVPLLDDGRVILERQYRYPLGQVLLEFPAGKIDPGEPTAVTARRELAEETGLRAREWACVGRIHNAAAYSTEALELWFARGLSQGERRLDHGEHIDVLAMSVDELDALAARGELTDAKTLIGLLWLHKLRSGDWSLDWRPAAE